MRLKVVMKEKNKDALARYATYDVKPMIMLDGSQQIMLWDDYRGDYLNTEFQSLAEYISYLSVTHERVYMQLV